MKQLSIPFKTKDSLVYMVLEDNNDRFRITLVADDNDDRFYIPSGNWTIKEFYPPGSTKPYTLVFQDSTTTVNCIGE